MEEKDYRILFSEIVNGYSYLPFNKFGRIFLKHLGILEVAEIDDLYNVFLSDAINNQNALTQKQQEEFLLKEGLWSSKEEDEIKDLKKVLIDLEINYSKEYLKSRRIDWKKEIDSVNKKIKDLENQKSSLIGITAETYATKKSNEEYIKRAYYKDKDLKELFFSDAEFADFEEIDISNLGGLFNEHSKRFGSDILKRLALSPFFLNLFYLSSENPQAFYGRAVVYLTFYQSQIFSFGRYFKNILSEHENIPKSVMSDPNELIDWLEITKNYKELNKGKEESEAVSFVGAKKSDLEYLGLNPNAGPSLTEELKKKGGKLSMTELLALHGD